jgi:hypothetical protein
VHGVEIDDAGLRVSDVDAPAVVVMRRTTIRSA